MLPRIEFATFLIMLIVAVFSYLILTTWASKTQPVTPPVVALLLVANLIPAIALPTTRSLTSEPVALLSSKIGSALSFACCTT